MNKDIIGRILMSAHQVADIDPLARLVENWEELAQIVRTCQDLGLVVVLTSGTFDLTHIGHARYLREAKRHGHILVVGIDDDEKARKRKGEHRPVVPFIERVEMVGHLGNYADFLTIKKSGEEKYGILKVLRPDVLIAVEGTYTSEEVKELEQYCGRVQVLPRQAETSTSAKVRRVQLGGAEDLAKVLQETLPEAINGQLTKVVQEAIPQTVTAAYQAMIKGGSK